MVCEWSNEVRTNRIFNLGYLLRGNVATTSSFRTVALLTENGNRECEAAFNLRRGSTASKVRADQRTKAISSFQFDVPQGSSLFSLLHIAAGSSNLLDASFSITLPDRYQAQGTAWTEWHRKDTTVSEHLE